MRTTVAIEDNLLAHAKDRAAAKGLTLGEYLESAIQIETTWTEQVAAAQAPRLRIYRGGRLRAGIDPTSDASLYGKDEIGPDGLVH